MVLSYSLVFCTGKNTYSITEDPLGAFGNMFGFGREGSGRKNTKISLGKKIAPIIVSSNTYADDERSQCFFSIFPIIC